MEHKAKQHIFEISTDAETLLLAAESETVMDLWVIQLQMQTILNPRVAGECGYDVSLKRAYNRMSTNLLYQSLSYFLLIEK